MTILCTKLRRMIILLDVREAQHTVGWFEEFVVSSVIKKTGRLTFRSLLAGEIRCSLEYSQKAHVMSLVKNVSR